MDEDENYAVGTVFSNANAGSTESVLSPGGIIGFDLYYIQGSC